MNGNNEVLAITQEACEQIKQNLATSRQELLILLKGLQTEQLEWPTSNPGWNIGQTIAHLATIDSGMAFLATQALTQPQEHFALMAKFDRDNYNAAQIAKRADRNLSELVEEMQVSRLKLEAFLEQLSLADLATKCLHPALGEVNLYTLFAYIPKHEIDHTSEIRQALLTASSSFNQ